MDFWESKSLTESPINYDLMPQKISILVRMSDCPNVRDASQTTRSPCAARAQLEPAFVTALGFLAQLERLSIWSSVSECVI